MVAISFSKEGISINKVQAKTPQNDTITTTYEERKKAINARVTIYVAGPYSKGDVAVNVRNAFEAGNKLADLGFAPFVPHSTHFWHMMFPRPYKFWLELDNQFLIYCDGLLRLPGESSGSDKEATLAKELGIPVFYDIPSVTEHFGKQPNY